MSQVASALGAGDLDASHAEGIVFVFVDGLGVGGDDEAGPAAAGVEFGAAERNSSAPHPAQW